MPTRIAPVVPGALTALVLCSYFPMPAFTDRELSVNTKIDTRLSRWLVSWVSLVQRHARLVITLECALTVALATFVLPHLGINMDHKQLMASDLPFRQAALAFARHFPPLDDSLLVVIDAQTPEQTREAAEKLAERLAADREKFSQVYVPGAGSFFQRHALLYRSPEELDDFADHLARLQPVLAELSRDPSIANLASLVRLGLERERAQGRGAEHWSAILDQIADATVRVFDEYPVSISWESLMLEESALDEGTRQVIIAEPVLDFDKLLVAERAIEAIHAAAQALSLVPERGVRVRLTGNPALNYEEMLGLAWDVGWCSIFSFLLVTAILSVAFRSVRLVVAATLTLIVGLVWTAAVAALAIGQLNVVSIAFGVLFIGLGIDFAIHLGMQYVDAERAGVSGPAALVAAVERTGSSLVICALTTMVGLYAFVPTPYRGVAELGLISGTGMIIILVQTLTFFPALLIAFGGEDKRARMQRASHLHLTPPRVVSRHPGIVVLVSAAVGAVALALLSRAHFDINVVRMRDPGTESVQAFNDLLARSSTSPWSIDAVSRSLAEAERLSRRLRELDSVERALTLSDYVPQDQEEKLEILSAAAFMLELPAAPDGPEEPLPVEEQVAALKDLHTELEASGQRDPATPLARAASRLRDELGSFLERIEGQDDAVSALADLENALLGNFPRQLDRLRQALRPTPITLASLPHQLSRRLLAADGHARVQIFPRHHLGDTGSLPRFVDAVRGVAPDATGIAVNLVEFGRATVAALQQALLAALVASALMILLLFQRLTETALVLIPVLLAAALTGGSTVLLGVPFNFANVVVLPLLLGTGVDSGIHLVHRSLSVRKGLLATTTARAVFYSALTTIVTFASLAFSGHRGIASLGLLLVCGMMLMLACNLLVLPAIIELRTRHRAKSPSSPASGRS